MIACAFLNQHDILDIGGFKKVKQAYFWNEVYLGGKVYIKSHPKKSC